MNKTGLGISDALYDYLLDVSLREADVLVRLREENARIPDGGMQIAPDQGQFMALLVELIGARRTLEVGVFTGYSSLAVALALPMDGRIVACDVSEEWTAIARRYWAEAGVADKIDLRLAPALDTLNALIAAGEAGTFDFAFIDADKERYADYYERTLELLRPGGLVCIDNVLWGGRVVEPAISDGDHSTLAIRAFNEKLANDTRISLSLLSIGDGLTLARKR
ncbi:MAG: class I SAM-dependent methyltransferase [Alphaproteobacteria bacterium]|nr:class I SAM-dependent methyltransferase [Alphaproteobacteria bacterium]